jgi:NADH-quinone oxidoreductase subunit K
MHSITAYLVLAALLFGVGLAGVLSRRHGIVVLLGLEFMLNAANLNFIAFAQVQDRAGQSLGWMWVLFSIGVAAAEAAVGLALVVALYRHFRTAQVNEADTLKG